jgi:hypothetical protein
MPGCSAPATLLCQTCGPTHFCRTHGTQFHQHSNFHHVLLEWVDGARFIHADISRSRSLGHGAPRPCPCPLSPAGSVAEAATEGPVANAPLEHDHTDLHRGEADSPATTTSSAAKPTVRASFVSQVLGLNGQFCNVEFECCGQLDHRVLYLSAFGFHPVHPGNLNQCFRTEDMRTMAEVS